MWWTQHLPKFPAPNGRTQRDEWTLDLQTTDLRGLDLASCGLNCQQISWYTTFFTQITWLSQHKVSKMVLIMSFLETDQITEYQVTTH